MNFINPIALLAGGVMVALPVAIHLLTRPRPVRLPFSALRFLESALKQRRFFARLRDVIVLALRALLVAALIAAFARPFLRGLGGAASPDLARRIIILDCSASMDARRGGVRIFEKAQAQALRYVRRDGDARLSVILAGAASRAAFDSFSANYPALEAAIRQAEVRGEGLDVRGALAQAGRLLASEAAGPGGSSQLVIVTDLQDTNWGEAAGAALPPDLDVRIEYTGLGPNAGNLAVTGVSTVDRPQHGRPLGVRVEVSNFSGSDQSRKLTLEANGRPYWQQVSCPAWGKASATFELPAELAEAGEAEGWIVGTARIEEARDCLPSDDLRHFAFQVKGAPVIALVSREDPRSVGGSTYFLWRMLSPLPAEGGVASERVLPVGVDSIGRAPLAEADLIVINKPGRIETGAARALADVMLRGRPMVYFVSEPADAENLAALQALCGDELRLPVRFAALARSGEERRPFAVERSGGGSALSLGEVRGAQKPFRAFGDELPRLSSGLTASRTLATNPESAGAPEEVLARWSDGSAALVSTRISRGRLAVWNMDVAGSTASRSAFFIALLREQVLDLLAESSTLGSELPTGTARAIPLPPAARPGAAHRLIGPDGGPAGGASFEEAEDVVVLRWAPVGPPGLYAVREGERAAFVASTVCPACESDLRPTDAEALKARLCPPEAGGAAAGRQVTVLGLEGEGRPEEQFELWPWLLVAGVALMVVELAALKAFRT